MAGALQPGNRHVRSRHRTKSANPRDGTYPPSARQSLGCTNGRSRAAVASSVIISAGISPSNPIIAAGRDSGAVDGGLFGDHVDDHRAGHRTGGRAVGRPAAAAEAVPAGGEHPDGVGAALGQGAPVGVTHGVGQCGEAVVEGVPVGCGEDGVDLGQPVVDVADDHVAAGDPVAAAPHRVQVDLGHHPVDAGWRVGSGCTLPSVGR